MKTKHTILFNNFDVYRREQNRFMFAVEKKYTHREKFVWVFQKGVSRANKTTLQWKKCFVNWFIRIQKCFDVKKYSHLANFVYVLLYCFKNFCSSPRTGLVL